LVQSVEEVLEHFWQALAGLTAPSGQQVAPIRQKPVMTGLEQVPSAVLHRLSVQSRESSQSASLSQQPGWGVPLHTPSRQKSGVVQALPSSQALESSSVQMSPLMVLWHS